MELDKLSDEELVKLSQQANEKALEILLIRYKKVINYVIKKMSITNDYEEYFQECWIAVLNAIKQYKPQEGNALFKTFCVCCIKNKLISFINKRNNFKNKALSNSVSLSFDDEDEIFELAITNDNPESDYLMNESNNEIIDILKSNLSQLEFEIFMYYMQGYSYEEIGKMINKDKKSIDNAIQRIKNKMKQTLTKKEK